MKKIKTAATLALSSIMLLSCVACGDNFVPFVPYDETLRVEDTRTLTAQEYTKYNVAGSDDFGRTIVTVDGKDNEDNYVGLFYFLWLGYHNPPSVIYDISKITNNGANNEKFQENNDKTPAGPYHHWGESAFGYYNSQDPWVIRKHVEMFCLSGIDFLIFDVTNGVSYSQAAQTLFNILLEYQQAGWDVPKIMYYIANPESYPRILKEVYTLAYKPESDGTPNKYQSLWFAPDGKPLVTMHQNYYYQGADKNYGLDMNDADLKACVKLFEFKCRQWPNDGSFEDDGVPWIEWIYPQPLHNDWINVSIGQHLTSKFSDPEGTRGRGWDGKKNDHTRWREDVNFQLQWDTVYENRDEVRFTFVTGWNEWIALKLGTPGNYYTVDTYNAEYSRDIEPSKNAGDNTYMLLTEKIREYNYTEAKHYIYPKTTIDITKDDEQWSGINTYADFTNDCLDRNYQGYATGKKNKYTDNSGRNDISTVQVARDDEYMYFRVTVAGESITEYQAGDEGWMNIWINSHQKHTYNGYNYVINRSVNGNKTTIMKAKAKGKLVEAGEGDLFVSGNVMVVRVPLSAIGLGDAHYDIEFKVTDNISAGDDFDYLSFYNSGDSAPIGRLNYKYGY